MTPKPLKDRIGERYGVLEIIDVGYRIQSGKKRGTVTFRCECGNVKTVLSHNVLNGRTKSCGCRTVEWKTHTKHGLHNTRIYQIYHDMKQRCYNENVKFYHRYGGRGIKVCSEWLGSFECFYKWAMDNGYSDGLTIDRINNNGDYEPNNCRWADCKTQSNNTSRNVVLEHDGERKTIAEWSRTLGVSHRFIHCRVERGVGIEDIIDLINKTEVAK